MESHIFDIIFVDLSPCRRYKSFEASLKNLQTCYVRSMFHFLNEEPFFTRATDATWR